MLMARLRGAPFTLYLGTQASWFFAFGLQSALVPYLARVRLEGSPADVGLAQTALTAPVALLILFGGVAAERYDRRKLLAVLHAAAVVPPLAMAALFQTGLLSLAGLIAYGVMMGVIGAIMMPTRDAALNAAAEASSGRISIQRGVVLVSLVQFVAQIAGMAAAATAADIGPPLLIATQSIMLAIGGLAAIALPALKPALARDRSVRVGSQIAEGLTLVWRSPVIRPMAICMFGVGLFIIGGSFLVLLPLLVLDGFGGGLSALSAALMTFWFGGAVATIGLARFGHVERPGRPLAAALALGAASLLAFAFDPPFWAVLVLTFFWGASGGIGIAMSRSIVQEAAPPEALARVLSVYQLGFMAGAPIGAFAMGWIVEHSSPFAGALVAMSGVLGLAIWLGFLTPIGRHRGEVS